MIWTLRLCYCCSCCCCFKCWCCCCCCCWCCCFCWCCCCCCCCCWCSTLNHKKQHKTNQQPTAPYPKNPDSDAARKLIPHRRMYSRYLIKCSMLRARLRLWRPLAAVIIITLNANAARELIPHRRSSHGALSIAPFSQRGLRPRH